MDSIKKFEDFLDRMQGLLDSAKKQGHILVRVEDLENTFPELKESEDEKIRKALIRFFQRFPYDRLNYENIKSEEAIAWLEKQGETFTKKDIDDAYIEGMAFAKHELEKQSEQEESPCDKCKKKQPSHSCQDITALGRCYIEGINKSNKIEPKFKVGDWIVNSIETVQITGYDIDYGYQVDYKGNLQHRDTDIIEKEYHLWTIQDAKDGDVLYSPWCGLLWIFEDEKKCHVGYNLNYNSDSIVINKPICIPADVQPATKEQRDLLFAKMHEAGYEWEEEKKELKLLITNGGDFESENYEQKPTQSEDETSIAVKNPDAYKIGFADGEAHAKEEMQSSWSEAMYNFVNKWKSGKFGEVPLQKALSTKFDDYFNSVLDKSK